MMLLNDPKIYIYLAYKPDQGLLLLKKKKKSL